MRSTYLTGPTSCAADQMSNPIGFAKSEQKYECCYTAITNLPPRLRFSKNAIQLLELTNSKAFKRYGAARVLCGVDSGGQQVDEASFAAEMRRLQQGVEIQIPKADGGTRTILLQAWVVGLSADFPAAGALLPFMESTSAHVWCREATLRSAILSASRLHSCSSDASALPSGGAPAAARRRRCASNAARPTTRRTSVRARL